MASSAGYRNPECHFLNFAYDQHHTSSLTVLVNSVRFHITADGKKWKKDSGKGAKLAELYEKLISALKEEDDLRYTKPCSKANLRSGSSQDSGHGTSDSEAAEDQDSAVDVKENKPDPKFVDESKEDPDAAIRKWLLTPFGSIFDEQAPKSDKQEGLSVQQWYERPTMFYSLSIDSGSLKAEEEEVTEQKEKIMSDMIPRLYAPKWMRDYDIPWCQASDLKVLRESDDPEPFLPMLVNKGKEEFFLKIVDPSQSSPTKREVKLLKDIEKLGLHKKMRVPLIKSLVGYDNSKTEMVGFLLTAIDDPTPLTKLLDSDVSQERRDKFAKEAERMKGLLHENSIVWGDAKSDNFMVDKHDNLWIIDFGGSYTEGWVDPELMETVEGDNMGVERIVEALHDPDANTFDPEEDKTLPFAPGNQKDETAPEKTSSRKRKADSPAQDDATSETEPEQEQSSKRAKRLPKSSAKKPATQTDIEDAEVSDAEQDEISEDEEAYCVCGKPSSGEMIGCDNDDCKRQWFHFKCVGITKAPKSKKWYCDDCQKI